MPPLVETPIRIFSWESKELADLTYPCLKTILDYWIIKTGHNNSTKEPESYQILCLCGRLKRILNHLHVDILSTFSAPTNTLFSQSIPKIHVGFGRTPNKRFCFCYFLEDENVALKWWIRIVPSQFCCVSVLRPYLLKAPPSATMAKIETNLESQAGTTFSQKKK